MHVLSIGMLAHNEAGVIHRTIASLARQSVLDPAGWAALGLAAVEVIVVPNGCSDDTAAIAGQALAALPAGVGATVRELAEPGKSNAWNRFVHELARPDATLLALMDADIEFGTDDVLALLVRRLGEAPPRLVATDGAVKDYRHRRLTLFDRFSRRVSAQQVGGGGGLCGQLYCGQADELRRIWLPAGLPVEDGFIAAMLGTDGFTLPEGRQAVAYVEGARHFYEPVTGPASFIRHEARIIVGSVINAWLFTDLWRAGRHGHAGDYVRRRNADDPRWVEAVCEAERRRHGRWLVPGDFIWWRLTPLRRLRWPQRLWRAPVALAATLAALPAVWRANAILRRPAASRFW